MYNTGGFTRIGYSVWQLIIIIILLVILKVIGVIDYSWWWILSPLWLSMIIISIISGISLLFFLITVIFKCYDNNRKKI